MPRFWASWGRLIWTGRALPLDDALIDGVHAGDRLDQGGLSGAVVAHQGDHLTGVDLQFDIGERLDGAEPLGDPAQRQHGRSGHVNHLLRRLTGGDAAPGEARRLVQKDSRGRCGGLSVRRPAR